MCSQSEMWLCAAELQKQRTVAADSHTEVFSKSAVLSLARSNSQPLGAQREGEMKRERERVMHRAGSNCSNISAEHTCREKKEAIELLLEEIGVGKACGL